jgi:integrase
MARKPETRARRNKSDGRCPITARPRLRRASQQPRDRATTWTTCLSIPLEDWDERTSGESVTIHANGTRSMPRAKKSSTKGRKLPPEPLTEAEVVALIRSCSRRVPTGVRNAALIALLYRAGLRIGEALALKPKDIDTQQCTVRVLHGKGDKTRLAGLDEQTCAMLGRWMDMRASLGLTARQTVFCTINQGKAASLVSRSSRPTCGRCCRGWLLDKVLIVRRDSLKSKACPMS